ncbi:MAG: hypothetical protein E7554_07100 [Ruminococcaceae bacterium]|nr:hypothetical protein [Oscillospiraceae bacterium]
MKKRALRVIAVVLTVFMMLSMCGCEEMLSMMSEYSMDPSQTLDSSYDETLYGDSLESFFDSYGYDFGDYSYITTDDESDDSGSNDGGTPDPDNVIVISDIPETNVLDTTLRDPLTTIKGNGRDVVTIMVYLCASNLESDSGLASIDLKEMMDATASGNVNIVIETGGCKNWKTSQISGSTNQRHIIQNGRLTTVEKRLGQKDMTDGETLTDFIKYCAEEYPANRNMLILWDHGAGSVDGWGSDEYNFYDTLTIDELGEALYNAGVTFDFIGFDACLMSTMEVACVLYDFADYMIASEDYESGYGWEYKYWISELAKNTSIPTPELAKHICDDFITESGTEDAILAAIDLSYMKLVYSTWRSFAFAAKDQLLDSNFTWTIENEGSRRSLDDLLGAFSLEADIADMMAIANSVENVPEAEALISALASATVYCSANSGCAEMTGLAVTLPYGDSSGYNSIKRIFGNVGFDSEYIDLLGEFTSVDHGAGSYDWSDWYGTFGDYGTWSDYYNENGDSYSEYDWDSWGGWEDFFAGFLGGTAGSYYSDYFSDYYDHYDEYSVAEDDSYDSYDDFYSSNYGESSMEDYYNEYYNDYYDHGFGYSDYDLDAYNDYYDYYDYYYGDYYSDYFYGDDAINWDDWYDNWYNW